MGDLFIIQFINSFNIFHYIKWSTGKRGTNEMQYILDNMLKSPSVKLSESLEKPLPILIPKVYSSLFFDIPTPKKTNL